MLKGLISFKPDTFNFSKYSKEEQKNFGIKFRKVCEELGPAYIKLGQLLSTRTDLITPLMANEMAALQDSVAPFDFDEAKRRIEKELGRKTEEIFESIEHEPVASGSIAQVYRAVLKTGETVAVKVRRPNVRKVIEKDLGILSDVLSRKAKHSPRMKLYDVEGMFAELAGVLRRELDFRIEAANLEKITANMKDIQDVVCPKVYHEYTSYKILTMEFIDGIKICDVSELKSSNVDTSKLAERFITSLLMQIFQDGFFQADPHPGNELVKHDGTLVFIDLGMIGKLTETFRQQMTLFLLGLSVRNTNIITHTILSMGICKKHVNEKAIEREISKLLDKFIYDTLDNINILDVVRGIQEVAGRYGIVVPREVTMVAKCLANAQRIVEILDPTLNVITIARDVAGKIYRNSIKAEKISNEITSGLLNLTDITSEFPVAAGRFLRKMQDNDFALDVNLNEYKDLKNKEIKARNFTAVAIIILAGCVTVAGILIALLK